MRNVILNCIYYYIHEISFNSKKVVRLRDLHFALEMLIGESSAGICVTIFYVIIRFVRPVFLSLCAL